MPVIYHDPNKRRRYDAFRIIDESKTNPLIEAIRCAQNITEPNEACHAWLKIAEFVYAKPRFLPEDAAKTPEESRRKAEEVVQMIRELEQDANNGAAGRSDPGSMADRTTQV